jgi:isoleucyl-tRNA synthetase
VTAIEPGVDRFALLPPERPVDDLEQEMLRRWAEEDLFALIERATAGRPEFVFYEGPPTANGLPGIHHVFSRTVKDLFCRYRVMKGHHVTRKAGWDTHGLPVEIEVEKQLGISGKQQIEQIGVERFNRLCRESVWKYKADWERLSDRIGYQLDYSDPYITYENDYVESVWWALRTLFDRGLLYRGHKILPYCPRCGTALSSHEVAQGYKEVKDPSVYVSMRLLEAEDRRILVWTTTPWTLVSNVALAVNPELEYIEIRRRASRSPLTSLILAESRASAVFGDDWTDRWEVVRRMRGAELAGLRYERPLDWVPFQDGEGEHELIVAESFVSAEDGTGVVHMAPAFGADDYAAGQRHGLAFLQPVNARGEFAPEIPVVGGRFVKVADPLIVEELERRGVLHKAGQIEHSYPHCWRCGTPLLYYARGSWFVRTTAVRDQMLARNARVDWHPEEVGSGRFGEWLLNNVDWALSRDRYWGTPLPIWVCDRDDAHLDVIGSYAELADRLGGSLPEEFDPHKPYVDRLEWPCRICAEQGGARSEEAGVSARESSHSDASHPSPPPSLGVMRRVPEVIDTWFDSGSMPFAQWHFPFEGKGEVERLYPADFIAEGVDQTRGWFYSLLAIATGLGEALPNNSGSEGLSATNAFAAPYRAVVVNDLVLDAAGQKMSKSTGNVVDPWSVIPRHGADAVRLFLITSSQIWVPRKFDERGIREIAGQFLVTLKNIYSGMFAQLANFGWSPSAEDPRAADRPAIDRWVLGRLARVSREVDDAMTAYDAYLAARLVMRFVTDDVSNWYVRLNRERFYDVAGEDNRAAFATLHEVLVAVTRMLAPFSPFVTDWMHRQLTGSTVHLASYVSAPSVEPDHGLDEGMEQVRTLARLGRAAREEADLKVRQPLARVVCVVPGGDATLLGGLEPLLRSELNVKRVELASSGDSLVRLEGKPNFRTLGKRFGKETRAAAEAVGALSSDALHAFQRGEPVVITVAGSSHVLQPDDVTVVHRAVGDLVVKEEGGYFAAVDPALTPALRAEGLARELVSRIQRLRKDAGFAVSDRIRLQVTGNAEVEDVVRTFGDYIAGEVLAVELVVGGEIAGTPDAMQTIDLDGRAVHVALTRV